ncbi:Nn.00g107390.m01.CDS01 [Neocucurbitaria sp. VM-36]
MAIIQIWMSARSRIASLRDMILATRTGMRRERCQCYQQEEEFKQLMDEFMTVLNVTLAHDYDSQHRDTLSRLCRELNRSRNSLTSLRERYATLENILSNYEYQLQSVEEGVYRELEKRLQQHVAPEVIQIDPNSSQTAVPSHLEAVEDMGLRDRLYSRMGDLRIHLERLNNFEFDLREELEERDVLRAEGQVHLTTDTQFFEQARDERARIQQELEEVQTEVQELRKRCNRGGIDYEEPQFPEVLYHTSFRNSASTSDPTGPQPEVQRESSAIISDFFTAQERINQWLEHPSDSPMSDGEVARVNAEERTRRESSSSDLVWVRTPSPTRRPNSMRSVGRHGSADYSLPQWRTGPPPGSSLLEALLLESASTPLGRYASPPEANATPKTGRSLS